MIYLSEKFKLELKTFLKIDKSIYPSLKGLKHGETKLEDIKNFLISSKYYNSNLNKRKIWPKYIIEAEHNNKKILENVKNINNQEYLDKNTPSLKNKKNLNSLH